MFTQLRVSTKNNIKNDKICQINEYEKSITSEIALFVFGYKTADMTISSVCDEKNFAERHYSVLLDQQKFFIAESDTHKHTHFLFICSAVVSCLISLLLL